MQSEWCWDWPADMEKSKVVKWCFQPVWRPRLITFTKTVFFFRKGGINSFDFGTKFDSGRILPRLSAFGIILWERRDGTGAELGVLSVFNVRTDSKLIHTTFCHPGLLKQVMAQRRCWQYCPFRIGLALLDTVDEMVRDGSLSGDIANIIMSRVSGAMPVIVIAYTGIQPLAGYLFYPIVWRCSGNSVEQESRREM